MDHLLNWLWQGSVVGLATGVILRLLTRARAPFRYVLCWIALGVVLTLPVLPLLVATAPLQEPVAGAMPSEVMFAVPQAWWTSTTIVLSAWALWSAVHCVRMATALRHLRRARQHSVPFPSRDESQLRHWNGVRDLGRSTRLVLSDDVRAAAVLGCGSPVIAIAPALIGHLDREELDRVVIHEWAHVQRRDDLLNLAQLAVRAAAGWHPAVWWLNRQLQIERESACDEATIALTGSARGYAASLAKAASVLPATRRMVQAVGMLSSPGLHNRVVRILSHGRLISRPWSLSTAMTAAAALAVLAFCIAEIRMIGMTVLAAPFEASRTAESRLVDPDPAPSSSMRLTPPRDLRPKSRAQTSSVPGPIPARQGEASGGDAAVVTTPVTPTAGAELHSASPVPAPALGAMSFDAVPMARGVTLGAAPEAPAARTDAMTPWGAAADTGVAVGKASQRAAVATAGFFSRLGKKIAGSF